MAAGVNEIEQIYQSNNFTISSRLQTWPVMPASIVGVTSKLW